MSGNDRVIVAVHSLLEHGVFIETEIVNEMSSTYKNWIKIDDDQSEGSVKWCIEVAYNSNDVQTMFRRHQGRMLLVCYYISYG
jgi:hypothetical protein